MLLPLLLFFSKLSCAPVSFFCAFLAGRPASLLCFVLFLPPAFLLFCPFFSFLPLSRLRAVPQVNKGRNSSAVQRFLYLGPRNKQVVWATKASSKGNLSKKGLTLDGITELHCEDGCLRVEAVSGLRLFSLTFLEFCLSSMVWRALYVGLIHTRFGVAQLIDRWKLHEPFAFKSRRAFVSLPMQRPESKGRTMESTGVPNRDG